MSLFEQDKKKRGRKEEEKKQTRWRARRTFFFFPSLVPHQSTTTSCGLQCAVLWFWPTNGPSFGWRRRRLGLVRGRHWPIAGKHSGGPLEPLLACLQGPALLVVGWRTAGLA